MTSTMVAIELMTGETPLLSMPQMMIGRVFFFPMIKKVTKNSSKEIANVSIRAPIMDDRMSGNVTYRNVWILLAPRSLAASSTDMSNPSSLEFMISTAKGAQKRTWLMITVARDRDIPISEKNERSAIPSMMGGSVIGISTEKETTVFILNRYRVRAKDVILPMTTEIRDTTIPTRTLFFNAARKFLFRRTSPYHFVVRPAMGNMAAEVALKEKRMMMNIGNIR